MASYASWCPSPCVRRGFITKLCSGSRFRNAKLQATYVSAEPDEFAQTIVPFNDEKAVPDPPRGASHFKTLPEAIDGPAAARDAIAKAEYDLNAIRGVVDGILSHAISREEMQPWIKR